MDCVKTLRRINVRKARRRGAVRALITLLALVCAHAVTGCRQIGDAVSVRPRSLRDVPAERLAFRLEPDVSTEILPAPLRGEEAEEPLQSIKTDFETHRKEEALLRTVVSPDGQRALALYATGETSEGDFRMDLYAADGTFIRNILPPDLSGTFLPSVSWSPDGQQIAFIGVRNSTPPPTPLPPDPFAPPDVATAPPEAGAAGEQTPAPTPTVAPMIAPVPVFSTEQIYVGDRDGYSLRPLTTRDGLIYFQVAWAPDGHALAAVACKEGEWDARRQEDKPPAGRPRLIELDGRERLLDDRLADARPVWSPDSSKVATAFDTEVTIYDAIGETPTGASIQLREPLLAASIQYDATKLQKKGAGTVNTSGKSGAAAAEGSPPMSGLPLSFNPVVRLEWPQPEILLVKTGFVRIYRNDETVSSYPRWHVLRLSPQATVLS